MKVWRVEDSSKHGPYNTIGYSTLHNYQDRYDLHDRVSHPMPDEVYECNELRDYWRSLSYEQQCVHRFAFLTIENYLDWFFDEDSRDILAENDCQLVQYYVSEYVTGIKQVIYKYYCATPTTIKRPCNGIFL